MKSRFRSRAGIFGTLLCLLLVAGSAQAAIDAYMKIEGAKQGKFMGATDERITITDFSYQAPDKMSGLPSGRRMHSSITIVKEVDKATPMFSAATNTGEVLKNVEIDFVHPGPNGSQEIYKSLILTNATVTTIRRIMGGEKPKESITISFDPENAVAKNKAGNKTAMDDWSAMN
jgi:type VI secretion system secreted protein Hcp